jgi:hypothetical protein
MPTTSANDPKAAFEVALAKLECFVADLRPPLSSFKQAFGRDVTLGFLAELYVARQYQLTLLEAVNAQGADAVDAEKRRYQIKYRHADVLNVDINNFDFDYIVLVNIDANYALSGMWRLTKAQVESVCADREKFRKFQITQARFKAVSKSLTSQTS